MTYKMKGHTLPGINQRGNGSQDDGRAKSSAFQKSPFKNYKKGYYGEGDSPMKTYKKGYYGEGSAFNHPSHADHHGATKEQEEEYEQAKAGYVPGKTPSSKVDRSGAL